MQRYLFRATLTALLGLLITSLSYGCHPRSRAEQGAFRCDSLQLERTVHLFGDTALPACELTIHLHYPAALDNDTLLQAVQHSYLTSALGEPYAQLSPQEAVDSFAVDYVAEYKTLEPEYERVGLALGGAWLHYSCSIHSRTHYLHERFYSYEVYTYLYTGGAHGIYNTTYATIDLTQGTPLQLPQLFAYSSFAPIAQLLQQQLAKQEMTTQEGLSEMGYRIDAVQPTTNFYIDRTGVTWLYNPYDIAPYALGEVEIKLPYETLLPYIKQDSPIYTFVQQP